MPSGHETQNDLAGTRPTMPTSVDPSRLQLIGDDGVQSALLGFRCRDCGVYIFGPAVFCQACTSANLQSVEFGRSGVLYSYTVVRVPPAGWPGQVPYILGEIELPEGPHVLAEVVDCPESDLKIGMPVELALQPVKSDDSQETIIVYKWRPLSTSVVTVRDTL
jgi:uncharacterized OB-fold protein